MGADCSNCKCTLNDEEKILIINQDEKVFHKETRKKVAKSKTASKTIMNNVDDKKTSLQIQEMKKFSKFNFLVRKFLDRKIYLLVRKKFRVIF